MVKTMTLVKIAAVGGVATCTMGMLWYGQLNKKISQTEYYKEALKTLRSHKGAVHLLGEPIKAGGINVEDGEINRITFDTANLVIPVKGPKEKGTLYMWAQKSVQGDSWSVTRLELELKKDPTKRLLIKSEKNETE